MYRSLDGSVDRVVGRNIRDAESRYVPMLDANGNPVRLEKADLNALPLGVDVRPFAMRYNELYVDPMTGDVVEVDYKGDVVATGWDYFAVADVALTVTSLYGPLKAVGRTVITKVGEKLGGEGCWQ